MARKTFETELPAGSPDEIISLVECIAADNTEPDGEAKWNSAEVFDLKANATHGGIALGQASELSPATSPCKISTSRVRVITLFYANTTISTEKPPAQKSQSLKQFRAIKP